MVSMGTSSGACFGVSSTATAAAKCVKGDGGVSSSSERDWMSMLGDGGEYLFGGATTANILRRLLRS